MKRRLFTIASALSFLFLIASVFFWVRGYRTFDHVGYQSGASPSGRTIGGGLSSCIGEVSFNGWVRDGQAGMGSPGGFGAYTRPVDPVPLARARDQYVSSIGGLRVGRFWFARHRMSSQGTARSTGGGPLTPNQTVYDVRVPCWCLTGLFAVLPVLWAWRRVRRDLSAATRVCATCGYDLRASPDRCPECGTPVPAAAAAPVSSTA